MSQGPVFIFMAAILWALDGILRRFLFDLPPITIVFLEHLIGLIIISPFFFRTWKKESLSKKEWGVIGLVAFLSGVLGTLFFTTALLKVNFIQFSVVLLLQKLQPIFAILEKTGYFGPEGMPRQNSRRLEPLGSFLSGRHVEVSAPSAL